MTTVKSQLINIVKKLPEPVTQLLFNIAVSLFDDVAIPNDIEAHTTAMSEYLAGETTPHNAINWD